MSRLKSCEIISALKGKLFVSCQDYVEIMIDAAIRGGAAGLRINSPADVRYVRQRTEIPILGCNKMYFPNSPVYITPSVRAAVKVIEAGADLVALDCTDRPRTRQSPGEIIGAIHELGALAVADLSSVDQAQAGLDAGADILATTLGAEFDTEFIRRLSRFGVPVLAEGGIDSPEQAHEAIECGAWAVCVGTAITRPHLLTMKFRDSLGD